MYPRDRGRKCIHAAADNEPQVDVPIPAMPKSLEPLSQAGNGTDPLSLGALEVSTKYRKLPFQTFGTTGDVPACHPKTIRV